MGAVSVIVAEVSRVGVPSGVGARAVGASSAGWACALSRGAEQPEMSGTISVSATNSIPVRLLARGPSDIFLCMVRVPITPIYYILGHRIIVSCAHERGKRDPLLEITNYELLITVDT